MEAALALLAIVTVASIVVAIRSSQQSKRARVRLDRAAATDSLTGLPNRAAFSSWLEASLQDSRRSTRRVAVAAVELLRFQHLNDTYGYEVGDALMRGAAEAIREAVRPEDFVARYSGPQFVVGLPDVTGTAQVVARLKNLLETLQRSHEIGPDRIRLAACAGVVITDQQHTNVADVVFDAEVALHQSAAEGRNAITVFETSMRSMLVPSTAEHRLRRALDHGEFWLLYLPVVRVPDQTLIGVEALLRWVDPEVGIVGPRHFMQALDETNLIVPVGNWVIAEACRQAKVWRDRFGPGAVSVTVNVAPRQVLQTDFAAQVLRAIETASAPGELLTLEITEGALTGDVEQAWSTLRELEEVGVKLCLDDFGTGRTSLGHLRRFKLDALKIDRSFVRDMVTTREDAAIVQQVIALAHALDMQAIAEGVENAEQAELLRSFGVDGAQGFYYCTPQPADVIDRFIAMGRIDRVDRPLAVEDVRRGTSVRPEL